MTERKPFLTLGKTKFSKFANGIVLIGLIIYALSKLGLLFELEQVQKVNIRNEIISQMGAIKIKSDLDNYLHNYLNKIKPEEIRNAITVNYILNENSQVTEVEILSSNNSSKENTAALTKLKNNLERYVNNKMLQEYLSKNTIKQVTFNSLVIEKLSNEEKQNLLQEFFTNDKSFANTDMVKLGQQIEFKFIVDKDSRIWQIEIISKLPKNEAEKIIAPIHLSLQEFADVTMVNKAKQKGSL